MWFVIIVLALVVLTAAAVVATRRGGQVRGDPDLGRGEHGAGGRGRPT
ncbi:MAG TPA: hypothetical protein VGN59_08035 [Acidimicrobiia bacterium]|jgi:hypothetical protein